MQFMSCYDTPDQKIKAYLAEHRYSSVWHTPGWLAYRKNTGKSLKTIFFAVASGENVCAAGAVQLCLKGRMVRYGYIQGGFLYDALNEELHEVLHRGLLKLAKKERLIYITIDSVVPDDPSFETLAAGKKNNQFARVKPVVPRFTTMLSLALDEDTLLAQMKPKGRYNIKLAEKKGVTVRKGAGSEIAHFYHLLLETTARDGFRANDQNYYEEFVRNVPGALFLVAEHEGEIIAGGLFTYNGPQALYYYGASANHKRNLMAPYLLQWEAIRYGKAHKCAYYDFMGVADPERADDPLAGVTEFKMKFGGDLVRFNPSYELVANRFAYDLLRFVVMIKKRVK